MAINSTVGRGAFTVAATFKQELKMYLFRLSYPGFTFYCADCLLFVVLEVTVRCLGHVKK